MLAGDSRKRWNFWPKGDSMWGQWILNLSARLETFSQLRLAEVFAGLADYVDAMAEADGGK